MPHISGPAATKAFFGMPHLNRNVLCAIDIITTGPDTSEDTLLEIAVLPLDHMLRPHKTFLMFNMKMRPEKEVTSRQCGMREEELAKCILEGQDRYVVADLFLDWVKKMELRSNKKIVPLGWNWPKDSAYLRHWLGDGTFEDVFDWRYRDVLSIANYINDRADCISEDPIYAKLDFNYLANVHRVPSFQYRSATNNVNVLHELFKQMVLNPGVVT